MVGERTANATPAQFSIIIPVHDDWASLDGCLRSFAEQTGAPEFEVIVVDDGSCEPAPESIRQWNKRYPLSIIEQPNAGVAAARNRGIQQARGEILVFTDADCRFRVDCLSALEETIAGCPQHSCFQLHLVGDCSSLVGRAEHLRLIAIQEQTLQANGCIRYLNTSGFAIRRSQTWVNDGRLFDPAILRGEDTLLLVSLIQQGQLPFFVDGAVVQHSIPLSFVRCLRKDIHCAWLEGKTFEVIARTGVRMRMRNRERVRMMMRTWRISRQSSIGRFAWMVLVARQFVERMVSVLYTVLHP